jgi:hypothetical protein
MRKEGEIAGTKLVTVMVVVAEEEGGKDIQRVERKEKNKNEIRR